MDRQLKITLRSARVNKGLTQEEASKLFGINKYTLFNYESGKTVPGERFISLLPEVYGLSYDNIDFSRH